MIQFVIFVTSSPTLPYIGQTKRRLNTRLKEHRRDTLSRNILKLSKNSVNKTCNPKWPCFQLGLRPCSTLWKYNKQTLALRQASEESACILLSFFCDNQNLQAYLFFIVKGHKDGGK